MKLWKRIKEHSFELQHVIILFVILVVFQIVLSFLNNYSSSKLISETMNLYKENSAERIANLSATSLELLLEQSMINSEKSTKIREEITLAIDIIINQQMLQQNIDDICILVSLQGMTYAVDDGDALYSFFIEGKKPELQFSIHKYALRKYQDIREEMMTNERIISFLEEDQYFQIFVPFIIHGEYQGAVYLKITPDVTKIRRKISTVYQETSIVFSALILFGLLAMFYITSYTVEERDITKDLLFRERELQLKLEIAHEKEALFTKRIYHAHHKAEKIMGFIKEEIRNLSAKNIGKFKFIVSKYSNFISRVIYDMKWYDPPVHVTRNPMFKTDINEILRFLVEHVFNRVYAGTSGYHFKLDLDENLPKVHINEYVIWETLEPLIQNCIDHNRDREINIILKTHYYADENRSEIIIQDDGIGISAELLEKNENGISKLFLEHISSKKNSENVGYGCYIASEICRKKCGWDIGAANVDDGGSKLIINIS